MNELGNDYIKKWSKIISVHNQHHPIKFKSCKWYESKFQECLMRLGCEFRLFGLDMYDTKNIESVVIASLQESFFKKTLHKSYKPVQGRIVEGIYEEY